MKRSILLLVLAAGVSQAADVHYTWLPFSSNVPGAPQTTTAVMQWGINVMMDSDNPTVSEFEVTAVIRLASGEIRTTVGKIPRDGKAANVQYSTIYALLVDSDPQFAVLEIQVKALSTVSVTQRTLAEIVAATTAISASIVLWDRIPQRSDEGLLQPLAAGIDTNNVISEMPVTRQQ